MGNMSIFCRNCTNSYHVYSSLSYGLFKGMFSGLSEGSGIGLRLQQLILPMLSPDAVGGETINLILLFSFSLLLTVHFRGIPICNRTVLITGAGILSLSLSVSLSLSLVIVGVIRVWHWEGNGDGVCSPQSACVDLM